MRTQSGIRTTITTLLFLAACSSPENETPTLVDVDGDGFDESVDCNDESASIHPGAEEFCDDQDNNCDGRIDEGMIQWVSDLPLGQQRLSIGQGVETVVETRGYDEDSLNSEEVFTYDSYGNLTQQDSFSYDELTHRRTLEHVLRDDGQPSTSRTSWQQLSAPDDVIEHLVTHTYDEEGRPTERVTTRFETGVEDEKLTRTWSENGQLETETRWATNGDDTLRLVELKTFTALEQNQGSWEQDRYADGSIERSVTYEVDEHGKLLWVVDDLVGYPLTTTDFLYDEGERLESTLTTGGPQDLMNAYTYSAEDNLEESLKSQRYMENDWQHGGLRILTFECASLQDPTK